MLHADDAATASTFPWKLCQDDAGHCDDMWCFRWNRVGKEHRPSASEAEPGGRTDDDRGGRPEVRADDAIHVRRNEFADLSVEVQRRTRLAWFSYRKYSQVLFDRMAGMSPAKKIGVLKEWGTAL